MDYQWRDAYMLSKKGVEKDYKDEWKATRYMIRGKLFAMEGGDKFGEPIITLKCLPELGNHLRAEFPDIVTGYYMNKVHWNSLYLKGDVPEEILKEMIDQSYALILGSLSKKAQREILAE